MSGSSCLVISSHVPGQDFPGNLTHQAPLCFLEKYLFNRYFKHIASTCKALSKKTLLVSTAQGPGFFFVHLLGSTQHNYVDFSQFRALGLLVQHSAGTLWMGSHGESSLRSHVQLRFFDPGWRFKSKFLDQACEEDEELHRGKVFSNAVSPPCNAKSMAVGGVIG